MQPLLTSLVLLACPLGMGLMMRMMMRMGGGNAQSSKDQPPAMSPQQQAELAQLRTELEQLRADNRGADVPRAPR